MAIFEFTLLGEISETGEEMDLGYYEIEADTLEDAKQEAIEQSDYQGKGIGWYYVNLRGISPSESIHKSNGYAVAYRFNDRYCAMVFSSKEDADVAAYYLKEYGENGGTIDAIVDATSTFVKGFNKPTEQELYDKLMSMDIGIVNMYEISKSEDDDYYEEREHKEPRRSREYDDYDEWMDNLHTFDDDKGTKKMTFDDMVREQRNKALKKDMDIYNQYDDTYQEQNGRKFVVHKKLNGDSFYPDYYDNREDFDKAVQLAQDRGYTLNKIKEYDNGEVHAWLSSFEW